MKPFTVHTGRAIPLRRSNVDTDQIIPARFLKRVTRSGFGDGLFAAWREDPGFVLNDERYAGATVLLAGPDFGTGSSREHAVWALQDYGFRAVVSPRFADIFRGNAGKCGLLAAQVGESELEELMAWVEAEPASSVTVDLSARELTLAGLRVPFEIDDYTRWRLLEGLDDIAVTLRQVDDIARFEARRASWLPSTVSTS
jgi:3-isopropylmalate/(R)-2-methylmalate dehydratase small subunit